MPLARAQLRWDTHGPVSDRFGDIYFNRAGGLAESRYVFLDGLADAWATTRTFTVGELGFGTGLNFLATWELWRRTRARSACLHYMSVEGYPLTRAEMAACAEAWPELGDLARMLLRAYPEPQRGFHRLHFDDGTMLTLLCGDVVEILPEAEARVDAWFLDGFAPDKNPAMWSGAVLGEVARLSHDGTRLATYSAAGSVRRGLESAGFDVEKAQGFAHKREMLRAVYRGESRSSALEPWFAPARALTAGRAVIIGGGIAGTSAAHALRRRGWHTTIVDRRMELAAEASGNPTGVLMPRLTAAPNLDGRFYEAAWRYTLQVLMDFEGHAAALRAYGLLQLAVDDAEARRQSQIIAAAALPASMLRQVDAQEASEIAGCDVSIGALYFPQGGFVQPRHFCAALAGGSEFIGGSDVATLAFEDGLWRVRDDAGAMRAEGDIVVLANGLGAAALPGTSWLPLAARRGQITLASPTAASGALRAVLTYGGYITPLHEGRHSIGATFDWVDDTADLGVKAEDHARNVDELGRVLPGLMEGLDLAGLGGRAGMRCMTPDHLPLVGPLPDYRAFTDDFAELRHGHPWARYPKARYLPGLFVLTGLGARGLVSAPMAGEVLAAHVAGEPWPLERKLVTALHPARFLVRDLKRKGRESETKVRTDFSGSITRTGGKDGSEDRP